MQVGGSVSGLLQGLQPKRNGANVVVFEQDPSEDRRSPESVEKCDATGRPAAIPARFISIAWRKFLRLLNHPVPRNMSNWGCLYLILRANFDGHDVGDGADAASAGRFLNVPAEKQYSGYIGWRGTVPGRLVSKETIEYFSNRPNFSLMSGTYSISYIIPTKTSHVEPGERLVNWVWYFRVPDNSPELKERYLPLMTKHLAEIVDETPLPLLSKVTDLDGTENPSSFFDGRLILIGDTHTAFRSHLGMASEQAARHCW
ncbi:hypothetical protein S7711_11268 [Stachybotrys chartarum IBT 7711]|uniref:2,6-dihydroxypyridine 3-monooxygenase substrate binding domain-containing protein n=1 Tax=Stachybotrys chartarum (strain CBS 109288 / IBT 7711) TaxID=1280523 RepID=A0A084BCN6_STACB|nr:hypothetical protein S7711_11268 [Stachybotrys chartarum IBT 7711]